MKPSVIQSIFNVAGMVLLVTLPSDLSAAAWRAQYGIAMLVIGIGVGIGAGTWLAHKQLSAHG